MNLAGLGYIAGGINQGMDSAAKRRLEELQAQSMQQTQAGQGDAGRALMSMNGITPPQQPQGLGGMLQNIFRGGQQPQQPQQPGPPMQLAGSMPAQGQPPMGGAPQQPQAPMQGGAPPQGGGVPPQLQAAAQHLDFSTLTNTLAKAPGMTPERLMGALSALQPYMNMQSQNDYKMAMLQVQRQNADSRATSAGAAKENADTNRDYKPRMAGVAEQNADVKQDNAASLIGSRDAKAGVDQEKLAQGKRHLDLIEQAGRVKDRASVELNYRGLQTARANALLAAHGDESDATVKGIDEQLKFANQTLQRMRDEPSQHPQGWEGQDKGRAEPLVATPMPEKPKGKVSVDGGSAGEPDMSKAKRAADGKMYVPDPARPGKYLRVEE